MATDIRGTTRTGGTGGGWKTPGAFAPADINESPGSGTLTLTGFAPTTASKTTGGATVVCDPVPAGALSLSSIAPLDNVPFLARPEAGVLSLIGFAPTTTKVTELALDNYTNIITALIKQTHHDDITACVDDLFRQGELRIFRRLRIRAMETKLSVMASTNGAPIPADYVELKNAHTIVSGEVMELERQPAEWILRNYRNRNGEAQPRYIGRTENSVFIFGPSPDADYLLNGCYYRRLQSLQSTSTNWFTTNASDLLMAAAKVEIYNYKEDYESGELWEQRFQMLATRVEREDRREHRKGSHFRSIPDMVYR